MFDFRILPMYDDMEKAFRYDPRGRGGVLLRPLSVFLAGVSGGPLYSLLIGRDLPDPVGSAVIVFGTLFATILVIGLRAWSVKEMESKFHTWLKEKHELVAPEGFQLGERNNKRFTSSVTGESVYMDVFSYPIYLEKSFLGIPYSVTYRTVELERIPAAPTFKV